MQHKNEGVTHKSCGCRALVYCVAKLEKNMANTNRKDPSGNLTKTIHCRLTEAEHASIKEKAEAAGLSITKYVVRAVLASE